MRGISEEIDKLMITIFDLENEDKNKLVLDLGLHRKLVQERDMLLLIRNNRTQFFKH
jgi:hypothetical protein